MKKQILFVIMLFVGVLSTNAQEQIGSGGHKSYTFSIGPKIGVGYNFISEPTGFNIGFKGGIGYGGGVAMNAHFGRRAPSSPGGTGLFGIQLEGTYVNKSFSTQNQKMNISGVDVPVLFQIYAFPALCFEVGPTFEFYGIKSDYEIASHGTSIAINGQKGVNAMLTAGIGLHLYKGLTIDLRYNYGLSPLNQNWSAKISTVSLGIGWLFTVIK